jgi:hypothetical protein
MSTDNRVVLAMEPGENHAVTELAVKLDMDYGDTFFALSRLESFGFVEPLPDNYFKLTKIGKCLRDILERR